MIIIPKNVEGDLKIEDLKSYYEDDNTVRRIIVSNNPYSLYPTYPLTRAQLGLIGRLFWKIDDILHREPSSPNEIIAKIKLLETKEVVANYTTTINEGKIRIIEVLKLSSPEFSPEKIRDVIRLPDAQSLTRSETLTAKEILDLHIKAETPGALALFTPEELKSFISFPFSSDSKNKIISYLKKTDKTIYTEIIKTLETEQKNSMKETNSILFVARLMGGIILIIEGMALITISSFPAELATPALIVSVIWLLAERAFGGHGETIELILLMSAILLFRYYLYPEKFLKDMSENFYEIGAVIIGAIALIKYINRNHYF